MSGTDLAIGGASTFGLSPWRGRHLVGVEGSTVPVCGVTTLDFHLADQAFSVDLVVIDSLKGTRIARATRLQDESLLAPVTDVMSQEKEIPNVSENVFAESNDELGRTNMVKQSVDTGNNPPIRQQFRRMPPFRREQACKLIEDMLKREIVQPSSSPWASPVVIATKKDRDNTCWPDVTSIGCIE
ncbi:hypothetical protein EMCRGX_G012414 [Ephydatia muelleri]